MSIEATEIIKKMKDLQVTVKNEADKKQIKELIQKIGQIEEANVETCFDLLKSTKTPAFFIHLLEYKTISIVLFDLLQFCVVNELYTSDDALLIINNFFDLEWDIKNRAKAFSLFFYFVRMKSLPHATCFRMLDLIVNVLLESDPQFEKMSRPVVCTLIACILYQDKIENNTESENTSVISNNNTCLLYLLCTFLSDCIIEKKKYYCSYMLEEIIKNKEFQADQRYEPFVKQYFAQLSLQILKSRKTDCILPVLNAMLEIKKRVPLDELKTLHIELKKIVSENNACDILAYLQNILPETCIENAVLSYEIEELLSLIIKSTDLTNIKNQQLINKLSLIINKLNPSFGIDRCVYLLFSQIAKLDMSKNDENAALLYKLYDDCLEYSRKFNIRELFENGITLGYTGYNKISQTAVISFYSYMQESWSIYFEHTSNHSLDFLKLFNLIDFDHFIHAMPIHSDPLIADIFEHTKTLFDYTGDRENTKVQKIQLFMKLIQKIADCRQLMNLILQFYTLNGANIAIKEPLKLLIDRLCNKTDKKYLLSDESINKELHADNVNTNTPYIYNIQSNNSATDASLDSCLPQITYTNELDIRDQQYLITNEAYIIRIYFFVNELLMSVSLKNCWEQVFILLNIVPDFENKKSQILLQIQESFMADLNSKELDQFFHLFIKLFGSVTNYQCLLNCAFIYGQFIDFTVRIPHVLQLWRKAIRFGIEYFKSNMIYQKDNLEKFAINQSIFKHIFRINKAVDKLDYEHLDFYETSLLEISKYIVDRHVNSTIQEYDQILFLMLEEWQLSLSIIEINDKMQSLLSLFSTLTCGNNEDIAKKSLLCIETIIMKLLGLQQNNVQFAIHDSSVIYKHPFKENSSEMIKNDKSIIKSQKTQNMNFKSNKSPIFSNSNEITGIVKLYDVMKNCLKQILNECDGNNVEILKSLFHHISLFEYTKDEVQELSCVFVKFVLMKEPYCTMATDCLIKICSKAGQFSYCLKILSSWLSKDQKDVSLSLIEKISEKLDRKSTICENEIKVAGLCNFLEYSAQFSNSEDFLVPVLDLICKCGCELDKATICKLLVFSKTFIIKQLTIKYKDTRETVIATYLSFICTLIAKDPQNEYIQLLCDVFSEIVRLKSCYIMVKCVCYDFMFQHYILFTDLLSELICSCFDRFLYVYLRTGCGISDIYTREVLFVLNSVLSSRNTHLCDRVKLKMTQLIVINDFEIQNLVRRIFVFIFENEKIV